jgi:hypothetical protein
MVMRHGQKSSRENNFMDVQEKKGPQAKEAAINHVFFQIMLLVL